MKVEGGDEGCDENCHEDCDEGSQMIDWGVLVTDRQTKKQMNGHLWL